MRGQMNIDITDKNTVKQLLYDINSFQNKKRKEKEWDAYQAREGALRQYVKSQLQELFPKNHRKMRQSDININKKVMDKIAKSYSMPPKRSVEKGNEAQDKALLDIYKFGNFNSAYRNFDLNYNQHKYSLFWVNYDLEKEKYYPQALKPFEYDVVRDQNTGELDCVILNYPDLEITTNGIKGSIPNEISDGLNQIIQESQFDSGTESKVYALWTKDNHVVAVFQKKEVRGTGKTVYEFSVTFVPIDGNPQNINPLGVIPFVYKQKGDSIDYPTANPLPEQSINFNVLYSDLMTAATMQGFGQAVLKYPNDAEIQELELGYMTAVKLPQSTLPDAAETDFKYVNASPDLEGQQKVYLTYLKQILSEHGINSSQAIAGDVESFASGLDRLIAQADVQWLIQENQEVYFDLENEVFNIVKAWQALIGKNVWADEQELKIVYPKPTILISDEEKLKNIKMLLDLRLKSRAQALQLIDPNISEDEAQEQIDELDSEGQEIVNSFMQSRDVSNNKNPQLNPVEQTEDDDQEA